MKLVTTTADLAPFCKSKSTATPLYGMKATGFRHIDLSMYETVYENSPWIKNTDEWKKEIEECAAIAQKDGLDFCQAHSPDGVHFTPGEKRDALITATLHSIEACAMLGIPHTVIHAQGVKGGTHEDFIRENVEFFKMFADASEKYGVDILVENSADAWNPEYYLNTGKALKEFVEIAGIPRLHVCWDTGHGNVQGCNQYDDITVLGSELHALHIQDNFGDFDSHLMPMSGTTNFDKVIQALLEIDYKGNFTFEGSNTIRRSGSWPNYRRDVSESDKLKTVPLEIQQKQISVMYDVGRWMLEQYGIEIE